MLLFCKISFISLLFLSSGVEESFVQEVSVFAKRLFRNCFADSSDKNKGSGAPNEPLKINFGELAVENTSASVQLVVWTMSDESRKCYIDINSECKETLVLIVYFQFC